MPEVSQATIAKKLGISQVAVSKAIQGKSDISPEVTKKVVELAEKLGYQPNRLAKSLLDGKTYSIGVITIRSPGYYFSILRDTLEDELMGLNYFPIILRGGFNDEADQKMLQLFMQYKVDGLIVMGPFENWHEEFFNKLINRNFPIVFTVAFPNTKACCVLSDGVAGNLTAVDYLATLGHSKIAYILDSKFSSEPGESRMSGYQKGMKQINSEEIYLQYSSVDSLRSDLLEAIDSGVTALICLDDHHALRIVRICEAEQIIIPEQLSLIGYANDFHFPDDMKIPLTTIAHNPNKSGKTIVELLMKKINGEKVCGLFRIQDNLIIRKSTGAPRA